jgi:transposase InsO family protein
MDLCGPIDVPTLEGSRYIATFYDDYSKLSLVKPLTKKSDTAASTIDVITFLEKQSGYPVIKIRTDNGSEYINSTLGSYLTSKGIFHQTTTTYTPQQNGKAERLNRTLQERARAMIAASGLPDSYWEEAVLAANYVCNRSPTASSDKTPWELFFNSKPNVSNLRIFGSTAYVRVPSDVRSKFDNA